MSPARSPMCSWRSWSAMRTRCRARLPQSAVGDASGHLGPALDHGILAHVGIVHDQGAVFLQHIAVDALLYQLRPQLRGYARLEPDARVSRDAVFENMPASPCQAPTVSTEVALALPEGYGDSVMWLDGVAYQGELRNGSLIVNSPSVLGAVMFCMY